VIRQVPGELEIVELEVADPGPGEIQVRMVASGLCHSDDHLATGDFPTSRLPFALGHEGAGVVAQVGPGVTGYAEGDHVVFSFLPSCGRCRWCATGHQNLCDVGATALGGGPVRLRLDGEPVGQMCGISTFCEVTTVSTDSAVKVPKDLPLDRVCLVGCGVGTGWGSAVNSAEVRPGDTVIVMGVGGIGINAVQGAAHAGASTIIAVDPVAFKREKARELGATHAVESMAEATELAKGFTNGQGADSAIVCVGVTRPAHVAQAFAAIRKAGTVVVTGLGDMREVGVPIALSELTLFQKRLQGSLFGASSPTWDIPRQLQMYREGVLKLDELVTRTYKLDDLAQGYRDLHAGINIRGVLVF
jgi:S-(hydroxymethyl)glutathione dehydrogenase/alcohol dehydrogenase